MKCGRCGKKHAYGCAVPFSRAWKGQHAVQVRLRLPSGQEIKIESDVSPELAKELLDIIQRIAAQPEPIAAEGSQG